MSCDRLAVRLATSELHYSQLVGDHASQQTEIDGLQARLAAVEAERDAAREREVALRAALGHVESELARIADGWWDVDSVLYWVRRIKGDARAALDATGQEGRP